MVVADDTVPDTCRSDPCRRQLSRSRHACEQSVKSRTSRRITGVVVAVSTRRSTGSAPSSGDSVIQPPPRRTADIERLARMAVAVCKGGRSLAGGSLADRLRRWSRSRICWPRHHAAGSAARGQVPSGPLRAGAAVRRTAHAVRLAPGHAGVGGGSLHPSKMACAGCDGCGCQGRGPWSRNACMIKAGWPMLADITPQAAHHA